MDPTGKSPNQILENELQDISSWHFFQAISWLDYAKRKSSPSAIQLAAFELRYGIEYLLFELIVLSSESMSEKEYEQCLGKPDKMKKMLNACGTNYMKLAEFCQILLSVKDYDLKIRFWDINELFRCWGVASGYLHFIGAHMHTFHSEQWIIEGVAELGRVHTIDLHVYKSLVCFVDENYSGSIQQDFSCSSHSARQCQLVESAGA